MLALFAGLHVPRREVSRVRRSGRNRAVPTNKAARPRTPIVLPPRQRNAGGLAGGILLLATGEKLFSDLVPFLILLASGLLALQNPVRSWLTRRPLHPSPGKRPRKSPLPLPSTPSQTAT